MVVPGELAESSQLALVGLHRTEDKNRDECSAFYEIVVSQTGAYLVPL